MVRFKFAVLLALVLLLTACDGSGLNSDAPGDAFRDNPNEANFTGSEIVTICHDTGNPAHPYVSIRVEAVHVANHKQHGDIIPAPAEGCGDNLLGPVDVSGVFSHTPMPGETAIATIESTPESGGNFEDAPPDHPCDQGLTIAEVLVATAGDGAMNALREAGLLDILNNPDRTYLLFLPEGIDFNSIEDDDLTDILLAHIVVLDQPVTQNDLMNLGIVETLGGETITITSQDGVLVLNGTARVVNALLEACNGSIYRIDNLLVEVPSDVDESDSGGDGGNVTICHRTNSEKNPYNLITVAESALPAHQGHGDIIPAPAGGCPSE